jgi:hypothetical protein
MGFGVGESVPVHCPECLRTQPYAAPVFPCACGTPVVPPVIPGATGEPVTHRNWTDEWVAVRCAACGREDEWPHPELGCACGAVLRVPVRAPGSADGGTSPVTPALQGSLGRADATGRDSGTLPGAAPAGPGTGTTSASASPAGLPDGDADGRTRGAAGAHVDFGPDPGALPGTAAPEASAQAGTEHAAPGAGAGAGGQDGLRDVAGGPGAEIGPETGSGPETGAGPGSGAGPDSGPGLGPDSGPGLGPDSGPGLGAARRRAFAERYPAHIPRPPTAPHPAPPRPSFRPVTIRTARDAVAASAGYLRWLGFRDVVQPEERSASGIDLRAPGLVAQVDPSTRPSALRAIECLWLNGLSNSSVSVFFSLAGYTPEARSRADELGIPLFVLDLTGTPQPVNAPADELITTGGGN